MPQEISAEEFEQIKAILGIDAKSFQTTKLGRYILDRSKNEEEELIEELIVAAGKSVDPELQRLSNEIYKRRVIPRFLEDAIQAGRAAEQNLRQMEEHETY